MKLDQDIVWECNDAEVFRDAKDNNLIFDKNILGIFLKPDRNLSVLNSVPKFLHF